MIQKSKNKYSDDPFIIFHVQYMSKLFPIHISMVQHSTFKVTNQDAAHFLSLCLI